MSTTSSGAAGPRSLIAEWIIDEKKVSLFREGGRLGFSSGEGNPKVTTFNSSLYDIDYAVNLIGMFRRTIGQNLETEEPHSSCFLPKLCTKAQNAPGLQVALFGRVDTRDDVAAEVKGLRWGVFDPSTKEEKSFPVDDRVAKAFVLGAPNTNSPHTEAVLDKDGKTVLKDAADHYAMTAYAKRFSIFVNKSRNQEIQNINLHRVSLLDPNVILNKKNWSVTLVSGLDSTQGVFSRFFSGEFGHAMLACEGVKEGKPFLRYVHFTQDPQEKSDDLTSRHAQIESFDRETPLDTKNGPTWIRSKTLVENMFQYVASMEKKPARFALYGSAALYLRPFFILSAMRVIANAPEAELDLLESLPENVDIPITCLECTYVIAARAGIFFCTSSPLRKPLEKIEMLQSAPVLSLPSNFDPKYFGEPFSGENAALAKEMVSACVFLAPDIFSSATWQKWVLQLNIENRAAMNREIERIRNATSWSEASTRQFQQKFW